MNPTFSTALPKGAYSLSTVSAFAVLLALHSQAQDRPEAHLLSPGHGWVLAGNRLLWTSNNGAKWQDITPPLSSNQTIESAFFLDATNGWTVLHQTDTSPGSISVDFTANGGTDWSENPITTDESELTLYGNKSVLTFSDRLHGWALLRVAGSTARSSAFLFQSSDGGKTWARLPDPPVDGQLRFFAGQTGWLCGGVEGNQLYVTRDSGQSWTQPAFPLPSQMQSAEHKRCLLPTFVDAKHGLAVMLYEVPESASIRTLPLWTGTATYTTSDGGDTWQIRNAQQPSKGGPGSIGMFDSVVVNAYYAGHAVITGQNFQKPRTARIPAGADRDKLIIRHVSFTDPQNGWFLATDDCLIQGCTSETVLLGTQDGGNTVNLLWQDSVTVSGVGQTGIVAAASVTPGPGSIFYRINKPGIDSCDYHMEDELPALAEYYGVEGELSFGFYLGGATADYVGCFEPFPPSEDTWLPTMSCIGYGFQPLWDDLQAPCAVGMSQYMSTGATTAASQGTTAADKAINALVARGF